MAKVVTPIMATVELITGIKQGQYGEYRSVLFKDPSGEKIWKSFAPDSPELACLTQGARVHLVPSGERNGKVSHNIVLLDAPQPPVTPSQSVHPAQPEEPATAPPAPRRPSSIPPTWTDEEKRQLSAAICDHADVFRFCLEVVQHKLGGVADARDYRAIATTLYIQMMKQQNFEEQPVPGWSEEF